MSSSSVDENKLQTLVSQKKRFDNWNKVISVATILSSLGISFFFTLLNSFVKNKWKSCAQIPWWSKEKHSKKRSNFALANKKQSAPASENIIWQNKGKKQSFSQKRWLNVKPKRRASSSFQAKTQKQQFCPVHRLPAASCTKSVLWKSSSRTKEFRTITDWPRTNIFYRVTQLAEISMQKMAIEQFTPKQLFKDFSVSWLCREQNF